MTNRLLSLIAAIFLILAIGLTSFLYWSYDKDFYEGYQVKHKLAQEIDMDQAQLNKITSDLVDYIRLGKEPLVVTYFQDREITQMEDFYFLYELARWGVIIFFSIFMIISAFAYYYKEGIFLEELCFFLFVLLIIATLILAFAMRDFSTSFKSFSQALFMKDFWKLDPNSSLLFRLMPQELLKTLIQRVLVTAAGVILLVQGLLIFLTRKE